MAPRTSKASSPAPKRKVSSTSAATKAKPSTKKTSTLTLGGTASSSATAKKPVKSLSDFHRTLSAGSSRNKSETPLSDNSDNPKDVKGKRKASAFDHQADQLWVDLFAPESEEDLAVHKRKVEDVRRWLVDALDGGPGGKMKKYRRILALTGPAGVGKTATIRVLAKELDVELVEWRNGMDDDFSSDDYESLSLKFQTFLERASSYHTLSFTPTQVSSSFSLSSSQPTGKVSPMPPPPPATIPRQGGRRQLILIEDLPNIIHHSTRESFHATLTSFANAPETPACPLVFIVSNAGSRGEAKDERLAGGGGGRMNKEMDDGVDVRSVIPKELLNGPYVIEIQFNPVAITLLRKAVNSLLDKVFSPSSPPGLSPLQRPPKDVVEAIISSANGDIRSAVMALQFACVVDLEQVSGGTTKGRGAKKKGAKSSKGVLVAITQREQSLALFHLLGKLLYNKRYGDPEEKEKDDVPPYTPPKLPKHLREEHERRLSKVDANVLYADSPVDTSLLSLYVHQNYTQFCDDVDQCDALIANLSAVDTIGEGESWLPTTHLLPHSFHMLALGTLHALPSPVARRGQKTFKPEFFDALSKMKDAERSLEDVRCWFGGMRVGGEEDGIGEGGAGAWGKDVVVKEMGKVLDGLVRSGRALTLPPTYTSFTSLPWSSRTVSNAVAADEDDMGEQEQQAVDEEDEEEVKALAEARARALEAAEKEKERARKGWLSDDDIDSE
ncbi:Cell cycle checkpoint protein rad17 [Tulasnella sp. 424]|nr:Cell cycle checkpoint protein rad17 [Tulasnella sp. 424]KAG8967512.1 Cell cycle checkpoint protein rad17 [Tulasnella sp. 425]